MRGEAWLEAILEFDDRLDRHWDAAAALDRRMLAVARRLARVLTQDVADLIGWHALGRFHSHRFLAGRPGTAASETDFELMKQAFGRCLVGGVDVPERARPAAAISAFHTMNTWLELAEQSPDAEPFTRIAHVWQRVVQAIPPNEPFRASALTGLARTLLERHLRSGEAGDLDAAIAAADQTVDILDDEDEDKPQVLGFLADAYSRRFELSGRRGDVDRAVAGYARMADLLPAGSSDRGLALSARSNALRLRYERLGDAADLETAVTTGQQGVEALEAGDPMLPSVRNNAGAALMVRFRRFGDPADLDNAIEEFQLALERFPAGHPDEAGARSNLAEALRARYEQRNVGADLDEAVRWARAALETVGRDLDADSNPARHLLNLGTALLTRAEQNGDAGDAQEAVAVLRKALAGRPVGTHQWPLYRSALAMALLALHRLSGDPAALDEGITVERELVSALSVVDPGLPDHLYSLTVLLEDRFQRAGDPAALHEAVAVGRHLVTLIPVGHPHLALRLSHVGNLLLELAETTRQETDLDQAVDLQERAVRVLVPGDPHEARIRAGLAAALEERFDWTGDPQAYEKALIGYRRAVQASQHATVGNAAAWLGLGRTQLKHPEPRTAALLDQAVEALRRALGLLPPGDDVAQATFRAELSQALHARFERSGDRNDLDEALSLGRDALEATPAGSPNLGAYRTRFARLLLSRPADLLDGTPEPSTAIERADLVLAAAAHLERIQPSDLSHALDPDAVRDVRRLAQLLDADEQPDLSAWSIVGAFEWRRFHALPSTRPDEEKEAGQAAVRAFVPLFQAAQHVPDGLRGAVAERVAQDIAIPHLEQAIASADAAILTSDLDLWLRILAASGEDHPERSQWQAVPGVLRLARYDATGDKDDLDASIDELSEALVGLAPGHPMRAAAGASLASARLKRHQRAGDRADLETAITLARAAVDDSDGGPPGEAFRGQLAMGLIARSRVTGSADDLEAGIDLLRQAADAVAPDAPEWASLRSQLSDALLTRYERGGDPADVDDSVRAAREAVERLPPGPEFAVGLAHLAGALVARTVGTRTPSDLDEAIGLFRQGIEATSAGAPERALLDAGLAQALRRRFTYTGRRADLDAAIEHERSVIARLGEGHPIRAKVQANLTESLVDRFLAAGLGADLDEAVSVGREAIGGVSPGHPDRPLALFHCGLALQLRFELSRDPGDLDEAIARTREAMVTTTDGHPWRPIARSNLGHALVTRYRTGGDPAVLDEGIGLARLALESLPDDLPGAAPALATLGLALQQRYLRSAVESDLDEAIGVLKRAVAVSHGAGQAENLLALGTAQAVRSQLTGSAAEAEAALSTLTRTAETGLARPVARITAARTGADLAAGQQQPARAAQLLAGAVPLLPLAVPRQLPRADQQQALSRFAFLAADAAALRLEAGGADAAARALGLLELGRGVLQGQALDLQGDLTELDIGHPALASRFRELRDTLSTSRPDVGGVVGLAEVPDPDAHSAADQFIDLLQEIRALEGFESFLRPTPAADLVRQAGRGALIAVNVSRYRSDALVVSSPGISHVRLPDLGLNELEEKVRAFGGALRAAAHRQPFGDDAISEVLEWLWDVAAEPMLRHLGHLAPPGTDRPWPRVWWIPGGLLGVLPLHAAGHHRRDRGETVMDRVISSYTPTVRALEHARERAGGPAPRRSLIVAMPETPDQPRLLGAEKEATRLGGRLPAPTMLVNPPDVATDRQPTRDAVLTHLPQADIAHFACHGRSDPADPSRSQLYLYDHAQKPFTVASLLSVKLHRAQLAYLSACETALTSAFELLDESIHLASAFQLAGYPHVVGTLWPINDALSAEIAGDFYSRLDAGPHPLDVSRSAEALHHAVRHVRDHRVGPAKPSLWAAHLHSGA